MGEPVSRFARRFTHHFGWRATFLVVAILGLVAMIGTMLFVPENIAAAPPASIRRQAELFLKPRLLLVFAMTAVGYGGSLIAFTYLAPILEQISGFSPPVVGVVLLLYGASVAVGNILGGKLADFHGPVTALKVIFALLAGVLMLLDAAATSKTPVLIVVLGWGAVAFGKVPALQVYVVKQAERFAPHSVNVASGMNIAAFNLGVAGGAWTGGVIVSHLGLMSTPWIASVVVLGAFALTWLSGKIYHRDAAAVATVR
jgi:DHA1 family inner membrane transport protein